MRNNELTRMSEAMRKIEEFKKKDPDLCPTCKLIRTAGMFTDAECDVHWKPE